MKFNVVVANPPFSLDKWGAENGRQSIRSTVLARRPAEEQGRLRVHQSHDRDGDVEGTGKVAVVVPHGVLFRGGAEGKIRQKLIEENLLDAVIGLPVNLFFGTGIPAAILVFRQGQEDHGRAVHRRQP